MKKNNSVEKINTVTAEVPLSEMFNYISKLRSITKGRGTFTMTLKYYRPVPQHIQNKLIKKARGES